MGRTVTLLMLVQRAGYKSENPKLALMHALATQTADLHLGVGDAVVPVVAFAGEGVLNCRKNQHAQEACDITSIENHIRNALLCGFEVLACREDLARFGMTRADLADAADLGAETTITAVPWRTIRARLGAADHLLFF